MDPALTDIAAHTLDARARARSARREHERARVLTTVEKVLGELLPAHGRVWLIGSLVWGGFFPASDIDIVVDGLAPDEIFRLERAVAAGTGRSVDLLDLKQLTPSFRQRVLADGVALDGT